MWRVAVGEAETSAVHEPATTTRSRGVFVCAHGAGGNMSDRSLLAAATMFRSIGLDVVRFNFPYRERKSGRPDPMPVLENTIRAVVDKVRDELAPHRLYIGGRSMGGRAASMLASNGFECDGVILLAYPLHPPGAPEKLRDAHLAHIHQPVSCFNGTRDAFCTRALMERVLAGVGKNWEMHWLEGADHSFHVNKSSGRTDADVLAEVGSAVEAWLPDAH